MIVLISFAGFILSLVILNFIVFLLKKKELRKPNRKWTNLDEYLPVLDEERKKVDESYYQEKHFVVVKGEYWNGMNYPYKTIKMTLNDRSILKWVCRFLIKNRATVSAYTSDEICGKMIYDRAHARRYIYS